MAQLATSCCQADETTPTNLCHNTWCFSAIASNCVVTKSAIPMDTSHKFDHPLPRGENKRPPDPFPQNAWRYRGPPYRQSFLTVMTWLMSIFGNPGQGNYQLHKRPTCLPLQMPTSVHCRKNHLRHQWANDETRRDAFSPLDLPKRPIFDARMRMTTSQLDNPQQVAENHTAHPAWTEQPHPPKVQCCPEWTPQNFGLLRMPTNLFNDGAKQHARSRSAGAELEQTLPWRWQGTQKLATFFGPTSSHLRSEDHEALSGEFLPECHSCQLEAVTCHHVYGRTQALCLWRAWLHQTTAIGDDLQPAVVDTVDRHEVHLPGEVRRPLRMKSVMERRHTGLDGTVPHFSQASFCCVQTRRACGLPHCRFTRCDGELGSPELTKIVLCADFLVSACGRDTLCKFARFRKDGDLGPDTTRRRTLRGR